jgi:DNA-binding response OmpR family regulator
LGHSGHDTFVRIEEMVPDMKVVFVSGQNLEVEQKELAGLDGVGFLQKPFSRNQLLIVVEALLIPTQAAA